MNYSGDGYNERSVYINNSKDANIEKPTFDNSFARMRVEEHRNQVNTAEDHQKHDKVEAKGTKDNFVLRNCDINNCNFRANSLFNFNKKS